jgi:uncharacterized protein (DUF2141 family)
MNPMKAVWLLALMAPVIMQAQHRLEIMVEGVETSTGIIQVALFTTREGFLKPEGAYRTGSIKAQKGTTRVLIEDLPAGTYALAIFHDLNENEELDKNWVGIPKEPMGFSNARMKTFGPPKFEDCRVHFSHDMSIAVRLE